MKDGIEPAVQELDQDPREGEAPTGAKRRGRSSKAEVESLDVDDGVEPTGEGADGSGTDGASESAEVGEAHESSESSAAWDGAENAENAEDAEDAEDAEGVEGVEGVEGSGAQEEAEGPDPATDEELVAQISALLFASPDPVGVPRVAKLLGTTKARVQVAIAAITERLEQAGLGFGLRGLAGGSTFMTHPALGEVVASLSKQAAVDRISPAALETLSVVAYRGPVTKAEIEAIRGVQAGPMLRSLVDRGLVRVVGRSEEPGHALQYGTTKEFLLRFGLESLADLPRDGELARD